jgi:hypothetical protein
MLHAIEQRDVTLPKPLQTCVFEAPFHPHSYPAESHLYYDTFMITLLQLRLRRLPDLPPRQH